MLGFVPWHIDQEGGRFCVKTGREPGQGDEVKCHPTRLEATAHMRALYANAADLSEFDDAIAIISLDDPAKQIGPRVFRKRILRWGRWSHPNAPGGVLDVTPTMAKQLLANFSAGVWDHVALTKGHPKSEKEAIESACGRVLALEMTDQGTEDDGVYAVFEADEETAPKIGKTILGASGGLLPNYVDHEVGGKGNVGTVLGHLALTNEPYIKDLGPFESAHLANRQRALLLSERTELPEDAPMTLEELIAKAKELKLDPKVLAKELGLDVEAIETEAAKVPDLEAELEKLKKPEPPKVEEPELTADAKAAAEAATENVVAALSSALVGAKVIELAEGEKPTLPKLVEAIAEAVAGGKAAGVSLSEQKFEFAFTAACKEGRAVPAQKEALKDAWVRLGEETFTALTKTKIVDLGEFGTVEDIDLAEPPGGGADTAAEIDRYAELSKTLG